MKYAHQNKSFVIISIASLIIITLCIYWPGLKGPLLLDDGPQLKPILDETNNNWINQYKEYILSTSSILKRPVSMLSFIFNAALSGNNIWYWKLTNVVLHVLTSCSVFFLTRLIISLHISKNTIHTNIASLCVTLAWALHPLQVSTVLYLVQRMTILSSLFTFCALLTFIQGFINEINKGTGVTQLLCSAFILFPLALFSKENAALIPIYIIITTAYILKCSNITISKTPKAVKYYIVFMLLIAIFCLSFLVIQRDYLLFDSYKLKNFTLYQRILTEPRVLFLYLAQIITALPSSMGFFHDDFLVSIGLFSPFTTFTSCFLLFFISAFSIALFNKLPLAAFGLLFFLSSHIIESTILPLEIAFEHRNYIGIWGILIFLFAIILNRRKIQLFIACPFIIVLASLTYQRATIWSDANTMYQHMISIHPNSQRLNTLYANAYMDSGQYKKAIIHLQKHDNLGSNLHRLIIQCRQTKKLSKGALYNLIETDNNISIDNYEFDGIVTLSNFGLDHKCDFSKVEFIQFLTLIVNTASIRENNAQKIYLYLAHYYYAINDHKKAYSSLKDSHSTYPENPIPLFLMTEWLINDSRIKEAKTTFIHAKQISYKSIHDYSDFIERITPMIN